MEEKKKGRGGKREGSGRKKVNSNKKKVTHGCIFRPDVLRTLKKIKKYNSFLESALIEKFERENIKIE